MREWLTIIFLNPKLIAWMGSVAESLGKTIRWALRHEVPTSIAQVIAMGAVVKGVSLLSTSAAWIVTGAFILFTTIWRGSDV